MPDEESVLKIFEVFDSLIFLDVPLISTSHFSDLIQMFLTISSATSNSDEIRCQSISFLMWSVMSHKTKIANLGLVPAIINSMFPIGAEEEEDSQDDDEETPVQLAFQVIDSLSTTFPPQQVYPEVMKHVVNYVKSQKTGDRKAAMLAISVLTEGCSDSLRTNITDILLIICGCMQDVDSKVRESACIALSSLCSVIGEEVAEYHAEILPLLFNLIQVCLVIILGYRNCCSYRSSYRSRCSSRIYVRRNNSLFACAYE